MSPTKFAVRRAALLGQLEAARGRDDLQVMQSILSQLTLLNRVMYGQPQ